jgi:hypothetical protein
MAEYGDVIEEFAVDPLTVQVKYSCVRRDLYEIRGPAPLPAEVRSRLARHGETRGSDRLFVVEVPAVHQTAAHSVVLRDRAAFAPINPTLSEGHAPYKRRAAALV